MGVHWKDWCWSWSSSSMATWCEELPHLKRSWCWERLRAGGEGDDRGWDGWMTSRTRWRWVWVNSGCWWWTGRLGVLRFMGSQRVRHVWATELNWTELNGKEEEQSLVEEKVRKGLLFWQILYAPHSLPPIPDDSENGALFFRVCIRLWICLPLFACEHFISFRPHNLQEYEHSSPV